ncbi:transposase [Chitinimonas viridis]|uniref:Transposase n=1 Tax=Chitinimonas viridis TaxID=664880 RepID=A0ABT8B9G9_9NEIS|nr:transposase [Chitinimonas viridis]MDN3578291.1 transposase [Chitinimonas viridis]
MLLRRCSAADGTSNATSYNWRNKFGGTDVTDGKRSKPIQEENARLNRLLANQALDIHLRKKALGRTDPALTTLWRSKTAV